MEGNDWGEATVNSHLVDECHRLRYKPVSALTPEELRILIGQEISLDYLLPAALDVLTAYPLVGGNLYPVDLLGNVLELKQEFWDANPDLKNKLDLLLMEAMPLPLELDKSLSNYLTKFNAIHDCQHPGISESKRSQIYKLNAAWYLTSDVLADEKAIADGEAEEIGEIMLSHSFLIKYCPFCGLKLS